MLNIKYQTVGLSGYFAENSILIKNLLILFFGSSALAATGQ